MSDQLPDQQRHKLALMIALREQWQAWQNTRTECLMWAVALVDQDVLTVAQACQALGISQASWYRHRRALRAVPGSQTEADVLAAIDQVLRAAGADETTTLADVKNNPDLELALAAIGVHHRTDQEQ